MQKRFNPETQTTELAYGDFVIQLIPIAGRVLVNLYLLDKNTFLTYKQIKSFVTVPLTLQTVEQAALDVFRLTLLDIASSDVSAQYHIKGALYDIEKIINPEKSA